MSWGAKTLGQMLIKPTVNLGLLAALFGGATLGTVKSNHISCQRNALETDAMVHKLSFTKSKSEVRTSR